MGLLSPGFRVQVPVGLPISLLLLLVQIQPGLKGIARTGKRCNWFQQRDSFLKALTTTPFVLVASTPLDKGRGWFESDKVKAGFQCRALHRASLGGVQLRVK